MTDAPPTFDAFYAVYLTQHRHPANRVLHLLAKVAMVAAPIALPSALALLVVPVAGVAPCWLGHWLFEHNQPTALSSRATSSLLGTLWVRITGRGGSRGGRPWYSFAADLRMCARMLGLGDRRRA